MSGVQQEAFAGYDGLADIVVLADVTGDLSRLSAVYVVVEDPDALFQPNPSLFYRADGRDNELRISPKPLDGRTGTFTGPLRVNVCADPACSSPLRGSPVLVPYSFQVLRGLSVSGPQPVALASDFGQLPTPANLEVTLPEGASSYEATLVSMSINAFGRMTMQTAGNRVTLTPKLSPVENNRYQLSISATGRTPGGRTENFSMSIPVTYDVRSTGTPVIFSPELLAFTLPSGPGSGSGNLSNWVRFESLMSTNQVVERVHSVNFLGGLTWLRDRAVNEEGHKGVIEFQATTCSDTAPPPGVSPCMAPGQYTARIVLRTRDGSLLSRELEAVLTITP